MMKIPLIWKMVLINVLSVGIVVGIVALAIHYLAADYFMKLVKEYNIAPDKAHTMFLEAIHGYLAAASIVGCGCAVVLSLWLTHRVLGPLDRIRASAGQIARGDYATRVDVAGSGEVAELATSFNQMAESLLRIERLRKDLVINVAHELRTPLTNIRGYLEALLDAVVSPSTEVFESLQEETLRLVKLVDDLLQLARADAARTSLRLEPTCLAKLIAQSLELFRLKFEAKGIRVESSLEQAEPETPADGPKLTQVLINLLENAWRYTPPGGHVAIHAESTSTAVTVMIRNTIVKESTADTALVFERFYRAEPSRSREHGGAGIGLAIVKELVEAHGGSVGSSLAENEARFWFTLPR